MKSQIGTLWKCTYMHLSSGHPVKCLPSVEVQVQPLEPFLLPPYPSPSQFSCKASNELSKLENGGKTVILLFVCRISFAVPTAKANGRLFFSERNILYLLKWLDAISFNGILIIF